MLNAPGPASEEDAVCVCVCTRDSAEKRQYFFLLCFMFAILQQVFGNCSCVADVSPANSSQSVRPGRCPQTKECSRSFTSYMAISVLSSFIDSLGITPGSMLIIRSVK